MGSNPVSRQLTDAELERLFPEHPWRNPVPVRWLNQRRWEVEQAFACAFCLYRRGLLGPAAAPLLTCQQIEAHLGRQHPGGGIVRPEVVPPKRPRGRNPWFRR